MRDPTSVQRVALLAGFFGLAVGCSRHPPLPALPPRLTATVIVYPAQLTLQSGGTAQLSVQANDVDGRPVGGAHFRYTTTDPQVLRVSDRGLVTALGPAISQTQVIVASDRAEQRVPVEVRPGPPQRLEKLDGDGQSLRAGDTPRPLSARIMDEWGNPEPGLPLSFEATTAAFPSSDQLSAADGTVRFDVPPLTRAGAVVVAVHPKDSATPAESFSLRVAPGAPAHLSLAPDSPTAAPPEDTTTIVGFLVSDAYDNPLADIAVRVRVSKTDKHAVLARTGSGGIATVPVPRSSKARRMTLIVDLVDAPDIQGSFVVRIPSR